jgi:hypothetical protein
MAGRTVGSFSTRIAVTALIVLVVWAVFAVVLPLAELPSGATLFGLSLRAALALPTAVPVLVLTMFWLSARQNLDDSRFRDDG